MDFQIEVRGNTSLISRVWAAQLGEELEVLVDTKDKHPFYLWEGVGQERSLLIYQEAREGEADLGYTEPAVIRITRPGEALWRRLIFVELEERNQIHFRLARENEPGKSNLEQVWSKS